MDAVVGEPVDFTTLTPVALRGYLRRAELMPGGVLWTIRLEALAADGRCAQMTVSSRPQGSVPPAPAPSPSGPWAALCHGDTLLACCVSALVGANEEVIYETGASSGELCAVSTDASQGEVRGTRRDEDAWFNQPASPCFNAP